MRIITRNDVYPEGHQRAGQLIYEPEYPLECDECETPCRGAIRFPADDPWHAATICKRCLEKALALIQRGNADEE